MYLVIKISENFQFFADFSIFGPKKGKIKKKNSKTLIFCNEKGYYTKISRNFKILALGQKWPLPPLLLWSFQYV